MVKAQAAMEYITTYGWMLLILVVVLAALAFLGILSPPRPIVCNFQGNFVCKAWKLTADANLTLDLYQNTGHDITVSGINCTRNPSDNPTLTTVNVFIRNNDHELVANGTNIRCLDVYGKNATGRVGSYYTGKILVYYTEKDSGMPHLVTGDITVNYE
jgi:hypothetical protein